MQCAPNARTLPNAWEPDCPHCPQSKNVLSQMRLGTDFFNGDNELRVFLPFVPIVPMRITLTPIFNVLGWFSQAEDGMWFNLI